MKEEIYGLINLDIEKPKVVELILVIVIVTSALINLILIIYYKYTNIFMTGTVLSLALFNLINNIIRVNHSKLGVNKILFTEKVIKYFIVGGLVTRSIYVIDIDYIHIQGNKCTIHLKIGKPREFTLVLPEFTSATNIIKNQVPSVMVIEE